MTSRSTATPSTRAEELRAARLDEDEIAVLGELHQARVAEERRRVRGEERLAVGEAHDHRAAEAGADELPGVVLVDDDERKVALELAVDGPDGLEEIALVRVLDQVRHGLGVGLRGEHVPRLDAAGSKLAVVLDDPVEDDRDAAGLGRQRVRIRLGDSTVRRPARVPKTGRGRRGRVRCDPLEVLQDADRAVVRELVAVEERDPRGVVAPVLEALQSVQKQRLALTTSDISDDPAHLWPPCPLGARLGHRAPRCAQLLCRA